MWVTAYCDASWSRRQRGAWAVWLRSNAGRFVRHGLCPAYVTDSTAAELAAVFAAIHMSVSAWGDRVTGVLVCSDCQSALELADVGRPLARNKALRRLQERIRALVESTSIALRSRWVKGHQPSSAGTAAFLNNWCDRSARQARRRA